MEPRFQVSLTLKSGNTPLLLTLNKKFWSVTQKSAFRGLISFLYKNEKNSLVNDVLVFLIAFCASLFQDGQFKLVNNEAYPQYSNFREKQSLSYQWVKKSDW